MDTSSFWHVDLGHCITAGIFSITWLANKLLDRQKKDDKVEEHSRWISEHTKEDEKRDEILNSLTQNLIRLTTFQETTQKSNEYRLQNLETDMKVVRR